MKKFIAILVAILMLAFVLSTGTASAEDGNFSLSATLSRDKKTVDVVVNVSGLAGKEIVVIDKLIITFDATKFSIPNYEVTRTDNNGITYTIVYVEDDNFKVGAGTAIAGYDVVLMDNQIKILYCSTTGRQITSDGALITLKFDVIDGETAEGASFSLDCESEYYIGTSTGTKFENISFPSEPVIVSNAPETTYNPDITTIEPIKGDINSDGKINAMDLLLIKQHILDIPGKKIESGTDVFKIADMNDDGKINGIDLLLLKKKILV